VTLREVADHFPGARPHGKGYTARCPCSGHNHDEKTPSLDIDPGREGVLLQCRSQGHTAEQICAAVGLTLADLFDSPYRAEAPRVIVATYDYTDAAGAVLYQAVRYQPKDFRQRHANGSGWTWNMTGVRKVPYRLHDLQGQKTVYVVEGEKDADALQALGVPATTNIGGAGKWTADYAPLLVDAGVANVVVLPDNDPPGLTHGRSVADACTQAGLRVKLVPLPVPTKGDVSDYLATHTLADLGVLVRQAPLHDPHRPVAEPPKLVLLSLGDLLSTPDDEVPYVVDGLVPAGSICLFCAPPKTGKSTATRSMALAVARGASWLDRRTAQGTAWVFAFEDKKQEVKKHFAQMGATAADAVEFFIGGVPLDLLRDLHDRAVRERPRLIVVDHLGHVLAAKDFNDYAQVTTKFAPLVALARESGAALVLNYHASSHADREGINAVLGSTAIVASVDNVLIMRKLLGGTRVLSSVQRIGDDLDPTVISLDKATGWLQTEGTKRDLDAHVLGDAMLAVLREAGVPLPERSITSQVDGRRQEKLAVFYKLIGMGWILRFGKGGRSDPFHYTLPELVPEGSNRFHEVPGNQMEGGELREPAKNAGTSKYVRTSTTPADVPSAAAAPLFDPKGWRDDTGGDE
jgi:hypothetical protein